MKNTNKAFTLVELIVVITILAILGTIAFISLQGYSQDAKNSKVATDLSQLASKINIATSSKDAVVLADIGDNSLSGSTNNGLSSGTGAGIELNDNTYKVGVIDFTKIKENGANFKDPEGKDYILATVSEGSTAVFTLAGQTKDASGKYTAVINGSYYKATDDDVDSLVSEKGEDIALSNGKTLTGSLY